MKKTIAFLSIIVFLVSGFICFQPLQAQAATKPTVSVSNIYEERSGKYVTVGVFVEDAKNLANGSMKLSFDPAVLDPYEVSAGSFINGFLFVHDELAKKQNGEINVAFAASSGVDGSGTLFQVKFRTKRSKGETSIKLSDLELFDEAGNAITPSVSQGKLAPFSGKDHAKKVESSNKQWVVRFNHEIRASSVNPHTVYVTNMNSYDKNNPTVPVDLTVGADGKSIVVTPKDQKYVSGSYELIVTDQVRSKDGKKMAKPVRMAFQIK